MSDEHAKREIMPIEEATVSKMRGIAGIAEVLERKGKHYRQTNKLAIQRRKELQ